MQNARRHEVNIRYTMRDSRQLCLWYAGSMSCYPEGSMAVCELCGCGRRDMPRYMDFVVVVVVVVVQHNYSCLRRTQTLLGLSSLSDETRRRARLISSMTEIGLRVGPLRCYRRCDAVVWGCRTVCELCWCVCAGSDLILFCHLISSSPPRSTRMY